MIKKKVIDQLSNDPLMPLRHSAEHVLHMSIEALFKGAQKVMGPPIEDGFYHDFDCDYKVTQEDFLAIEKRMQEIIDADLPITRREISYEEAKKVFTDNKYKLEFIEEHEKNGDQLTVYEIGEKGGKFYDIDFCAGPHLKSTGGIKAFKLLNIAGAYWRGNEKNKMLQRIYATAFDSQEALEKRLAYIEESKKRDHRKLGKDLDLFSIDEYVGAGIILWHPKLSVVREEIETYWRQEHRKKGYSYVYTPHIGLSNLWQTSGHLDFFKDGMYPPMNMEAKDTLEKTAYYVKPMSCPFHVRIYKSRPRSYRELPIRWCELGSVYRYEESGVLHGMLRVRGFTQDDAHVICEESQFVEEVNQILDFALEMSKVFGYDKLNVYLSVRDPENKTKYVGGEQIWELAENTLNEILQKRNINYKVDEGGAKFYGPAIDLKAVDSMGREWQGTTIQLDMNLPDRFGMTYIGQDGQEHTPIMLHRTLLGSMERFVGTLIEHYAGAFPVWLAPVQVKLIPISEKHVAYAKEIEKALKANLFRVELDDRSDTMQAKIRDAQNEKVPYMFIIGDKEIAKNSVSIRLRTGENHSNVKLEDAVAKLGEMYLTKSLSLW
jgi:threonyl-tRNA synthetase